MFVGASRRRTGRELSQLRVLRRERRRTRVRASPLRGDFVVPYSHPRRPSPPETLRRFSARRPVRSGRDDAQLAPVRHSDWRFHRRRSTWNCQQF